MLPRNCCHPIVATEPHQMLPANCCQPRRDDDATTTTRRRRRRRDDAEAATAWASRCTPQVPSPSLQVPSALTVAAAPKRPGSRCSLCGHSPQALPVSWAPCSPSSRCSPLTPHSVAAAPRSPSVTAPKRHSRCSLAAPCSPSSRCSPQVPLTVAAAPHAVTVAAASRASLLLFTPYPRGWVRIAVRIEAGRDDDEGTTTGAGGVSRAMRIAVRIEAERDDDDAATTSAGGVSGATTTQRRRRG